MSITVVSFSRVLLAISLVLAALGLPSVASAANAQTSTDAEATAAPVFDPNNFNGGPIDNVWFPLTPGTTLVYRGVKDSKKGTDVFHVTNRTRTIAGVKCVVVEDSLVLYGRVAEKTRDYYAQDLDGNVWYLGEDTATYDRKGNVIDREGTWHAGVDGAQAGVFMPADPQVGDQFRQEYYAGHAEDHFRITSMNANVSVPYGTYTQAMRTREWTPLEPGVVDGKYYVQGIGEVREVTVHGPFEELRLAQIITN